MQVEIGPNLLALLQLVVPSILALVAAYYARQSSVQSAKTNGHVALLMRKEGVRAGNEKELAERRTSQNKEEN